MTQLTCLWTVDRSLAPAPSAIPLPGSVDVAVIGSGYTGLHAACALADAGASVAVLDAHEIGWGASSRNGGMLNPGLKLAAPELFHRYGPQRGRRFWDWSLAAIDFVESFVHQHTIDCAFSRPGQVVLAYKPRHLPALRAEVAWHAQHLDDHTPTLVGPAELHQEIGTTAYYGGIIDPRAAALQPAHYGWGIARAAAAKGVILSSNTSVMQLRRHGQGFVLHTSQGDLTVSQVLLATNGYTKNIVRVAHRSVFAGGSYIIATEPLAADLQRTVSPRGRMFYDSKHFLNYFRLTPDGRMLFGGRHNLSADLDLHHSAAELRKRMVEVFPQLADVPIAYSWTGKLGLTFDLMPHAGRIPDGPAQGAFFALGYGGHGVAVASYLGHNMGKLMAAQPSDNPFLDIPTPRYFFTPYARLYLPLVSAWFRLLDRVS